MENSIGGEIIRKMIETEVSRPLINGLPLLAEDLVHFVVITVTEEDRIVQEEEDDVTLLKVSLHCSKRLSTNTAQGIVEIDDLREEEVAKMYSVIVLLNTKGRRAMIQETRRYLRVEKQVTPELEEDQVTRMKLEKEVMKK